MFGSPHKKVSAPSTPPTMEFDIPVTGAGFLEKRKAMNDVKYTDLPLEVRKAFTYAEREASNKFGEYVHFYVDPDEFNVYDWEVYLRVFKELGWSATIVHHNNISVHLKPMKEDTNESS